MSPESRQKVYVILAALLPVAAVYGLISDAEVSMWLTLAAAILGSGGTLLAAKHVPDADDYTGRHRKEW